MKLILICWFAVIMPMLHSTSHIRVNDDSINSPVHTLNHTTPGNAKSASFQENKILIKEFADIFKDYRTGLMKSEVEDTRRNELIQKVIID